MSTNYGHTALLLQQAHRHNPRLAQFQDEPIPHVGLFLFALFHAIAVHSSFPAAAALTEAMPRRGVVDAASAAPDTRRADPGAVGPARGPRRERRPASIRTEPQPAMSIAGPNAR